MACMTYLNSPLLPLDSLARRNLNYLLELEDLQDLEFRGLLSS